MIYIAISGCGREQPTSIQMHAAAPYFPPPPPLWFDIITWYIISASIHSPFFCEQLAGNSFRSATRVTTRTKQHITNQVRTRSAIASKFNNHTKPAPFFAHSTLYNKSPHWRRAYIFSKCTFSHIAFIFIASNTGTADTKRSGKSCVCFVRSTKNVCPSHDAHASRWVYIVAFQL